MLGGCCGCDRIDSSGRQCSGCGTAAKAGGGEDEGLAFPAATAGVVGLGTGTAPRFSPGVDPSAGRGGERSDAANASLGVSALDGDAASGAPFRA